jgi:SIR2-like domain
MLSVAYGGGVMSRNDIIERLRTAYQRGELTLYLGAGISAGNGLPSWERLVLAMYFAATEADIPIQAHPNYLFAIAEWHLQRRREPLDITARKIRHFYDEAQFIEQLRHSLYAGFKFPGDRTIQRPENLLDANPTLASVILLCRERSGVRRPVRSVITYNYDSLVEFALGDRAQAVWRADQILTDRLPIYHVHGYVPLPGMSSGEGSAATEIIFTEEQYHLASQDAYAWSNLVQLQAVSSSVGLMIGLSLTDRNMRRILDAVRRTPLRGEHYALIQHPQWPRPDQADLERIKHAAHLYYQDFAKSGIKTEDKEFGQIEALISQVEAMDFAQEEAVLGDLGVHVLWYEQHAEIPDIIDQVLA